MKHRFCRVLAALLLAASMPTSLAAENIAAHEDRASWFREAKFGMFIHWGLYAEAGGVWKEQKYFGIGEWLMKRAEIPVPEYETLASGFNPAKFNAHEWVGLAKAAGMKYIVITAKHHDGFAMFKSEASPFNIVDATPFKRDPMKELAAECQKADIKLCFYYSQWQDWHEPGGAGNTWDFTNSAAHFHEYFESKCEPQVKELLSNYGQIGLMWFDTPGQMDAEQSRDLVRLVRTLQPQCLVSSRVGNGQGDFVDLEDHEMPSVVPDRPWESLFTHNDSWGYVWYDKNWRSTSELLQMLIKINAKGGNFLLNIGPQSDGQIPAESITVLQRVGQWIEQNGEALYGSTASPFPPLTWGECTGKPGALYFHILTWPADGILRIPGFKADIRRVSVLSTGKKLAWSTLASDILVPLPSQSLASPITVIKLEYSGSIVVDPVRSLMPGLPNSFEPVTAKTTGQTVVKKYSWMQEFGNWKHAQFIEQWTQPDDLAEWRLRVIEPGTYRIRVCYSRTEKSSRKGRIDFGGQTLWFEMHNTGTEPQHMFTQTIGVVNLTTTGPALLRISPAESGDEFAKVEQVIVEPFN